jgi:anti-anti-sigma factor
MSLNARLESHGRTTLVISEGRLDFGACAGLQAALEQALASAGTLPAGLLVDCSGLDYVSSGGLRVFLLSARAAQRAGVKFALCALKPSVTEVFMLSGFNQIIPTHADRAAALEQMP